MQATLQMTPDELANIVAAAMGQNGMEMTALSLFLDGNLVGYDTVVIHHNVKGGLKVRSVPEAPQASRDDLKSMLYPEVPSGIKSGA